MTESTITSPTPAEIRAQEIIQDALQTPVSSKHWLFGAGNAELIIASGGNDMREKPICEAVIAQLRKNGVAVTENNYAIRYTPQSEGKAEYFYGNDSAPHVNNFHLIIADATIKRIANAIQGLVRGQS